MSGSQRLEDLDPIAEPAQIAPKASQIIDAAGTFSRPDANRSSHWIEHLRTAALSIGTYSIPAGGTDDQSPHTEDEIYIVTSGRAGFETAAGTATVGPGSVLFVPAGEPHRFTNIEQALALLVIFGPAEGTGPPLA